MDRLNNLALILFLSTTAMAQEIFPGPIMRTIAASSTTLNTSLVCYWKMDETSDGSSAITRNDSEPTGTAQNLVDASPGPTFITSTTGKIANCIVVSPVNSQYLNHADSADLSTGNIDFTFAGWFMLSSEPNTMAFLSKWGAAGNREYLLYYDVAADRIKFAISADGTAAVVVSADNFGAVTTATWYFVVFGHDSVNNQIFISINNGTPNTTAHTTGVRDGTAAFDIARNDGGSPGNQYLFGRVDEVGFWKKVLSASEITELYNAGSGKTCCPF